MMTKGKEGGKSSALLLEGGGGKQSRPKTGNTFGVLPND